MALCHFFESESLIWEDKTTLQLVKLYPVVDLKNLYAFLFFPFAKMFPLEWATDRIRTGNEHSYQFLAFESAKNVYVDKLIID